MAVRSFFSEMVLAIFRFVSYFRFAPFPEEAESNSGLCDGGGNWLTASRKITHRPIAASSFIVIQDCSWELGLDDVRESPAQAH
jgi:hypothetical protein